jgi:hypothetical protein
VSLEDAFAEECRRAVEECRTLSPPYAPTAWIEMMEAHGAVDAAKRLLESSDIQSGFERLVRLGRTDLTVEMAVLHPRWDSLFRELHREAAHWRLTRAARGHT